MFNEDLKNRFLEKINTEGGKRNISYILNKAGKTESHLNKDVYQMDINELDGLIKDYPNKSLDMVCVNVSILRDYIDFSIQEGYVPSRINYLLGLSRQELAKYVDKSALENKYLTYKELEELEEQCVNLQDAAPIRMLFMGLRGEELSELINLKIADVHEDKIVLEDREIPINYKTYDFLKEANAEEMYQRGNGNDKENRRSSQNYLNPSEYVLIPMGKESFGKINHSTLRGRITRARDYFGNPYLNPRNIWFSGILWRLKQIYDQNGKLEKEDIIKIHRMYGYREEYIYKTSEEFNRIYNK